MMGATVGGVLGLGTSSLRRQGQGRMKGGGGAVVVGAVDMVVGRFEGNFRGGLGILVNSEKALRKSPEQNAKIR